MSSLPATTDVIEQVIATGNLANLSAEQRTSYYKRVCDSLGLNPLTRPFEYITLNGKLTLYARKDATDQLRRLHGVSIGKPDITFKDGWIIVTVEAKDKDGRTDSDVGMVKETDMRGDLGNAVMKAVTKAKRRVTLSIAGLGMLDETEVETIPGAVPSAELPAPKSEPKAEPVAVTVDTSWYPDKEIAAADAKEDNELATKQCPEHDVPMSRKVGKHGPFYSHLLSDGKTWCNGKRKPEPAAASVGK